MSEPLDSIRPTWKLLGLFALAQALSFGAGVYSGHTFWAKQVPQVIQPNYITEPRAPATPTTDENLRPIINNVQDCPVKGNISGKNKIYHVAGGAFFERTQQEICFANEAEAEAAGFIKSSR